MCIAKVDQEHFCHFPILFIVDIPDEVDLYLLDFLHALRHFKDDKHPKIASDFLLGRNIDEQDNCADAVHPKVFTYIVLNDILYQLDSLASCEFYRNKVQHYLQEVKGQRTALDHVHERIIPTQQVLKDEGN